MILGVKTEPTQLVVNPMSPQALGIHRPLIAPLNALATWPTANLAILYPIRIAYPTVITRMFWQNGATVSGNVDIGIYDSQGNRIVSSGSTAQAGVSVIQSVDTTDVTLQKGIYYIAMACDNTTATFRRLTSGTATRLRAAGVLNNTTAFPLPSSLTLAGSLVQNYLPIACASQRSFI